MQAGSKGFQGGTRASKGFQGRRLKASNDFHGRRRTSKRFQGLPRVCGFQRLPPAAKRPRASLAWDAPIWQTFALVLVLTDGQADPIPKWLQDAILCRGPRASAVGGVARPGVKVRSSSRHKRFRRRVPVGLRPESCTVLVPERRVSQAGESVTTLHARAHLTSCDGWRSRSGCSED